MPKKENFPYEAIAIIAKVLEENSEKYEPGNWREIGFWEHADHAAKHIHARTAGDKSEDHFAHALTRLAMAVAVRETSK